MKTYYKLTDRKGQTRNKTQWGQGVTHSATGEGTKLCSDGFIHFYRDPLLAVLLNPAHADFQNPKLWECEIGGEELHESLKSGAKVVTTVREIPVPVVTIEQRVKFAELCAEAAAEATDAAEIAGCAADAAVYAAAYADGHAADAAAAAAAAAAYAANAADYAGVEIDFVALAHEACE